MLADMLRIASIPKGAYVEGWWGESSHKGATYNSSNPSTVAKQADLMMSAGITMVNHTFYGMRETIVVQSAKNWAAETAKRGMTFSMMLVNDMFNGITTDKTAFLIDQMNQSGLFNVPSYIPERAVWDFGALKYVNLPTVQAAFPNLVFWSEHSDYTWINAPGTRAQQVSYEKTQRANGRLKAPSIWYEFNDQSPTDCTQSVWGGPVRRVDGERGNMFIDLSYLPIPMTAKYLMYGTWDDYEEGTAIERYIAALLGKRIS